MARQHELGDGSTPIGSRRLNRLRLPVAALGVAVLLSACGSSSPAETSQAKTKSSHKATVRATKKSTARNSSGTSKPKQTSDTANTTDPYVLSLSYTSPAGWTFSNVQVSVPRFRAQFAQNIQSSPPGQAELQETITNESDPGSPLTEVVASGVADDNAGRSDGPTLVVHVHLAYELTKGSPDVEAGDCMTEGDQSEEGVTSAKQLGYPFDFVLDCQPGYADEGTDTGTSEDMPQGQVDSLVSQLNGEAPVDIITVADTDLNDGSGCTIWFSPPDTLTKVSPSMIPQGSNTPATTDCSKTSVSVSS